MYLGNECRSSSCIILESGRKLLFGLVVPRKSVNPRLDQNKTELGVLILAINFEMLANGNRLFDEVPKVLRDGWAKSLRFEDTENFVSSDETDLGNTMRVTEGDTDLGGSQSLTSKLNDLFDNVFWGGFKP